MKHLKFLEGAVITYLIVWVLLFCVGVSHAQRIRAVESKQTYVIYNATTKEVVSISPWDDAVVPAGHTKEILNEKFRNIRLTADPTDYKFINGEFVKNIEKISDRENAVLIQKEKSDEFKLIVNKIYKDACDALVTGGINFKHIDCADFQ